MPEDEKLKKWRGLSPLAGPPNAKTPQPPEGLDAPPLPRSHLVESGGDLPETPRWKKVLGAGLRLAGTAAIPTAIEAAETRVMEQHTEVSLSLLQTAQLQSITENMLTEESAGKLAPVLVVVVPGEKAAETKGLLDKVVHELPGEIAKEQLKELVMWGVPAALLIVSRAIKKVAAKSGSKALAWLSDAAAKLAGLLQKHPEPAPVTAAEVAKECQCTPQQAETVLEYLGFTQASEQWLPPKVADKK